MADRPPISDNIDYLLSKFPALTIKDFIPNRAQSVYLNALYSQERGDKGGFGLVVRIPNTNRVLKVFRPCDNKKTAIYCDQMRENISPALLPYGNKKILILPNHLAEGLIGAILSFLTTDVAVRQYTLSHIGKWTYSYHFTRYYASYYSPLTYTGYTVLDALKTDLKSAIKDRNSFYIMLFQVTQALCSAQSHFRFTHYDLHAGNILYIDNPTGWLSYKTNDSYLNLKTNFVIKIIDFSLSRLEYKKVVVSQYDDTAILDSYSKYNANYDILVLFGDLFGRDYAFGTELTRHLSYWDIIELFNFMLNENATADKSGVDYIYSTYYDDWRPYTSFPIEPRTPYDLLEYLTQKLIRSTVITQGSVPLASPYAVISEAPIVPDKNYNPDNVMSVSDSIIVISKLTEKKYLYHSFNRLGAGNKNTLTQFIHVAIIRPTAYKAGYRFRFDCCKLDPVDYIANKTGVMINGAPFDRNYRPVGPYRQLEGNFLSATKIPKLYENYYGAIVIIRGNISIVYYGTEDYEQEIENADEVCYAGPVLVYNNEVIVDEQYIETIMKVDGRRIKIFQSDIPYEGDEDIKLIYPVDEYADYGVFNNNLIEPGELADSSNFTERSMLITKENGDVAFVMVEKIEGKSQGADLISMAHIAKELGAHNAISLNNNPSVMAWRISTNPMDVYITNTKDLNYKAVGNVITVMKM